MNFVKREPGFYWIKIADRWEPAEWVEMVEIMDRAPLCYWSAIGTDFSVFEREIQEVGAKIEK